MFALGIPRTCAFALVYGPVPGACAPSAGVPGRIHACVEPLPARAWHQAAERHGCGARPCSLLLLRCPEQHTGEPRRASPPHSRGCVVGWWVCGVLLYSRTPNRSLTCLFFIRSSSRYEAEGIAPLKNRRVGNIAAGERLVPAARGRVGGSGKKHTRAGG